MNVGWTSGHYPPCKFLVLGFPEEKLRVIRDEQKERVVLGKKGGNGRDEDRHQLQCPTRGAVVLSSETG